MALAFVVAAACRGEGPGAPVPAPEGVLAFDGPTAGNSNHSIYLVHARAGGARRLRYGYVPSWSADRRWLAFEDPFEDLGAARITRADGAGGARPLPGLAAGDTALKPQWSPDGGWIAARAGLPPSDLLLAAYPDGPARVVAGGVDQFRWLADGRLYFLVLSSPGSPGSEWVVRPGGEPAPAAPAEAEEGRGHRAPSPDGAHFAVRAPGFVNPFDNGFYIVDAGGADTVHVAPGQRVGELAWSRDGRHLAFVEYYAAGGRHPVSSRVFVVAPDGSGLRPVSPADPSGMYGSPAW